MKRATLVLAAAVVLVASLAACTASDVARYNCLDSGRPVVSVPDNHGTWPLEIFYLADGTAIDARGDVWDTTNVNSNGYRIGMKFHEVVGSRDDLCLVGGRVSSGQLDPEGTSWETWHKAYGMLIEVDNFTVVGTSFANTGDMIAFQGGSDWSVIGVRAEGPPGWSGAYIHDDCIENDMMTNGIVEDSKFDGCNVFMSSNSQTNGSGHTVQITGSLVRLQAYRNSFNVPKYGENSHGGFFKFSTPVSGGGTPPKLVIKNSVFRADQAGEYGGNSNGFLGLPPGSECDNVMLVGTAAWQERDRASWQNQCTNLTFGTIADWNARVAAWDSAHP